MKVKDIMKTKHRAPNGLSAAAKAFYRKIVDAYELNSAGLELLRVAAFTLHRWDEAKAILDEKGLIVDGNIARIHPAAKIENDCRLSFCRLVKELGLSEDLK